VVPLRTWYCTTAAPCRPVRPRSSTNSLPIPTRAEELVWLNKAAPQPPTPAPSFASTTTQHQRASTITIFAERPSRTTFDYYDYDYSPLHSRTGQDPCCSSEPYRIYYCYYCDLVVVDRRRDISPPENGSFCSLLPGASQSSRGASSLHRGTSALTRLLTCTDQRRRAPLSVLVPTTYHGDGPSSLLSRRPDRDPGVPVLVVFLFLFPFFRLGVCRPDTARAGSSLPHLRTEHPS
jgi:hypothetical protein